MQAYLGQVLVRGGGPLDLEDASVRERIVATAGHLLDLGFDGIHYDLEPVFPGNSAFLALLARTHLATKARGGVLSVALEQLAASGPTTAVLSRIVPSYAEPDPSYLKAVAGYVDQVAIMTYDSGMVTAAAFAAYMAWQAERTLDLIGDRVTVFTGVPTAEDGQALAFHAWAEKVPAAAHGLRRALDHLGTRRRATLRPTGVAIFAEWAMDDADWQAYLDEWVHPR